MPLVKKISQLTAKGSNIDTTDLLPIAEVDGSGYATKHITGEEILNAVQLITTRTISNTSHTLTLADANKFIFFDNASAIAVTIPTNSSVAFPTGTQILFSQYGAGQVTISGDSGVTLNNAGSKNKTNEQHSVGTMIKVGTDEWYLTGDLTT
jgi:hypothetical protein